MNEEFFEEAESLYKAINKLLVKKEANSLPLVAALSTILGQTSFTIKEYIDYEQLDLMVAKIVESAREEAMYENETIN